MTDEFANIPFNYDKNPGIDFDILLLEELTHFVSPTFNPWKHHRVEFYVLVLVTEGKGKHAIDFQEFNIRPGSVMTIRKDQFHQYFPQDTKGFNLLFTEDFVVSHLDEASSRQVSELFNELFFHQHTRLEPSLLNELVAHIHEMQHEFAEPRDAYSSGIIRNLLQVVISKLHRARIADVQVEIDHRYMQQFLNFQELVQLHCTRSRAVQFYADHLNVTPKTLYNITQRIIRKSPKTFIDEELLLQIKRLLINSDLRAKEIAFQSGFDDPGNFFKFFKRLTGGTPDAFRKHHLYT